MVGTRTAYLVFLLLLVACGGKSASPSDGGTDFVGSDAGDALPDVCQNKGCNDGNACTKDECLENGECRYSIQVGKVCDDEDACTTGETCNDDGLCSDGQTIELTDDPCLKCSCDPVRGEECEKSVVNTPCDDQDCCTENDRCRACDAGAAGCNPFELACKGTVTESCGDTEACTNDTCGCDDNGDRVCTNAAVADGTLCDVGSSASTTCRAKDTCQVGMCQEGPALELDDENPCTDDSCDKGTVKHVPNSAQCDDGNPCTTDDRCQMAACVGDSPYECVPHPCAASVSCDANASPESRCNYVWMGTGAVCDDGDACTLEDHCDEAHGCVSTLSVQTEDGNVCTQDSCDPITGTVLHAPIAGSCDDGNLCTTVDECQQDGTCAGATVPCAHISDPCLQTTCNPLTGQCDLAAPDGASCADEDLCDGGESCVAGQCQAGVPVDCSGMTDPCLQRRLILRRDESRRGEPIWESSG